MKRKTIGEERMADSTHVQPRVRLIDGCEVPSSGSRSSALTRIAYLSLNERKNEEKRQDVDMNDIFPDEILLHIFKYIWRAGHCWDVAKVCKRWCILLACNQLLKRGNDAVGQGRFPCPGSRKYGRSSGMVSQCDGSPKTLKLKKVDSEWKLSMDFLKSCQRHTHALEINDCTHLSVRGYQLISRFVSNLKTIRLGSCNSIEDSSLDTILEKCRCLQTIHLSMAPKLALKNIVKKVPKLRELYVHGCRSVTVNTVFSVLSGCPRLRNVSFSAIGTCHTWDEDKLAQGPPTMVQNLEITNTLAVTDGFLRALSKRLTNLRKLDLSNCHLLSDDGLKSLIDSCGQRLEKLVVTRCPGITDESLRTLADVAINLRDVSFAGTKVSDVGLDAFMKSNSLRKLRSLSVARSRITDTGLGYIADKRKEMVSFKVLDVQNCPEVSAFGLRIFDTVMKERPFKLVSGKRNVRISEEL